MIRTAACGIVFLCFAFIPATLALAERPSASPGVPPKAPGAPSFVKGKGEHLRRDAAGLKRQADDLTARFASKGSPKVKEAAAALAAAKRAEADALEQGAAALEAGDAARVTATKAEREKAGAAARKANERLLACEAQQRNVIDPGSLERLQKNTPAAARAKLDAMVAARQAAAQAWAEAADKASGDGKAEDFQIAREKALALEVDARVKARDHELECEITREQEKASKGGIDLTEQLAQLRQVHMQCIDLERQRGEAELQMLKIERQRKAIREKIRSKVETGWAKEEEGKKVEKWISDSW